MLMARRPSGLNQVDNVKGLARSVQTSLLSVSACDHRRSQEFWSEGIQYVPHILPLPESGTQARTKPLQSEGTTTSKVSHRVVKISRLVAGTGSGPLDLAGKMRLCLGINS